MVETSSLMVFLYALPCEQAHRQSLQQHHQSLLDLTKIKAKTLIRNYSCHWVLSSYTKVLNC